MTKIEKSMIYILSKKDNIQVMFFMLEWKQIKIHPWLMHVLKYHQSGYVAGQIILKSCDNDEWYATSNAKRVVFCLYRWKFWKSQILMPAENAFMQWNHSLSEQYLKPFADGPIFVNLQCSNCCCPGCIKAAKNMLISDFVSLQIPVIIAFPQEIQFAFNCQ